MSNKKESEERNKNNINSYKYLVDSVKEIRKIILPNAEQTRESYRALTDSTNRMMSCIACQYSPDNFSKELEFIVYKMSQTLKTYLDNSAVASQDALDSMIELISDIQKEHIQKMREIDFTSLFSSMYKSVEECSLKNLRDVVEATYKAVQEEEDSLEDDADFLSEAEVKEAIDEQINNPKGFQERIKEWSEKR